MLATYISEPLSIIPTTSCCIIVIGIKFFKRLMFVLPLSEFISISFILSTSRVSEYNVFDLAIPRFPSPSPFNLMFFTVPTIPRNVSVHFANIALLESRPITRSSVCSLSEYSGAFLSFVIGTVTILAHNRVSS